MAVSYTPGSYQAGLVSQGYRDNGDGSFTSPDGQIIIPQISPEASAAQNNLAGQALTAVQNGYGANDPNFDPRYAMLSAEAHLNPTLASQYFPAPSGTMTDKAGNLVDQPPSFWSTWGPWLALAGVGGVMALPAIAGAAGASGAAAADISAPVAGTIGTGVPASVLASATPVSLGGMAAGTGAAALLPSSSAGLGGIVGMNAPTYAGPASASLGSLAGGATPPASSAASMFKNPQVVSGAIGAGTNLASGIIQSHAATNAANIQAQAAEKAAQIQAQSAAQALEFDKQQAALSAEQQAAAQFGNYQQWAAQQQRVGGLGQLLGLGPRQIPAYTPLPTSVPLDANGNPLTMTQRPDGTFTYAPPETFAKTPPTAAVAKRFTYQAPTLGAMAGG